MSNLKKPIVLIGGGGGVYRVARFLKHIHLNITTIQTIFDHGGHSGILRDERGVLPPGDIRQAILALANDESSFLRALFAHKFSEHNGSSLDNASLGNHMLTAATTIAGSLPAGIKEICDLFGVKGKVLPVSLDNADLCVRLNDGSIIKGEGLIDTRSINDDRTIELAFLEPQARIYVEAYNSIVDANTIVFCPGDLYTSIIPNTLVTNFKDAIAESSAKMVYVVNIMTKKAETCGFNASRFAKTLLEYIGRDKFDVVICNNNGMEKNVQTQYAEKGSYPVEVDTEKLQSYTERIIVDNLVTIDQNEKIIRHNSKVASYIATCNEA